ncbi:MAG: two-component system sensor histidine kinase KdbD [Betaproteobacteria bacterium]|nr:two-component system sensor histidine kinase KdbD [Betaproteobacteria bacterium]
MTENRQDPDELLAKIRREEDRARRGRLKIFFGASAGVGKTYAMLFAAHELRAQSVDVVAGIVETHGRKDTAALLDGLEVLPSRFVEYRGTRLAEFDLDGALARHPAVILVDELAHNNAAGSRHPKRCQDVEELLSAGINVYTTVNVQHLESLNDVIGGITGIKVWETVPDQIFDRADEVTLVDLPPDELLQRLQQGKVYMPAQAERAIRNFFRKGNLIALRELALRRTADRVDDQMLAYRHDEAIRTVWHTRESLLACVGPEPGAEKLVRSTARLAKQLEVEWHAVYVETPRLQRLPEAQRERILRVLKLAQELGAQTATIPGQSPAAEIVAYARRHNLARVVIGRSRPLPFARTFSDRIAALGSDLEVVQVGLGEGAAPRPAGSAADEDGGAARSGLYAGYAWSAAACVLATLAALPLQPYLDLANIVMLFLLAVVLVAVRFGRGPAVLAAFLSVGAFDFFFVPPRFSMAVSDAQYLIVFGVMLAVALIIGHLTSGLRYQARVAGHRETRARALYELSRELSGVLMQEQVLQISDRHIEAIFHAKAVILLPDEHDHLREPAAGEAAESPVIDLAIAQWVYDNGKPAGFATDTLPGTRIHYAPLPAPMRTRGVLALEPAMARLLLIPEQRRLLETFAALIAIALERVHYVLVAQDALVKIESERLRNSILSALSHDLRTPLTALLGLAESLTLTRPGLSGNQLEIASAIRDEAVRMNALVNNLLDMARLQAGEVRLNRQWQPLEEVVGSAVKAREHLLASHAIRIDLPEDLPLVEFDAVLIERVLCNLLENAAKYTLAQSEIRIEARSQGAELHISVADNGPGLAPGSEETIFEKFARGPRESATPGVGLGLTISRAIVEAHRGRIWAENIPAGGARFVVALPLGTPPEMSRPPEEQPVSPSPAETT